MRSILIKDTTREERIRIVHQALWGACGIDCEFCSGCDNRGGGRTRSMKNSARRLSADSKERRSQGCGKRSYYVKST